MCRHFGPRNVLSISVAYVPFGIVTARYLFSRASLISTAVYQEGPSQGTVILLTLKTGGQRLVGFSLRNGR